nr:helix-turn-helix domain-containing protein [Gilvimarinus sp. DA14]
MDIAQVAREANITAATLRYYEELMLIKPAGRQGLRRQYYPQVIQQLGLIALAQEAGFSLQDIGAMFAGGKLQIDREQLSAQADELDRRIKRLSAMRDGLRHAALCPHEDHLECDKFQRLIKVAQKSRQLKSRQAQPQQLSKTSRKHNHKL